MTSVRQYDLSRLMLCTWLILLLGALFSSSAQSSEVIDSVRMKQGASMEEVQLPIFFHAKRGAQGDSPILVEFDVTLPSHPTQSLGLYISRISRAGRLYVNGFDVGSCAAGDVSRIRCSNLPTLFEVPMEFLTKGSNHFQLELHAAIGQPSGLAKIQVGSYTDLKQQNWVQARFLSVSLARVLSWIALFIGLLSLIVGWSMHEIKHICLGQALLFHSLQRFGLLTPLSFVEIVYFDWAVGALKLATVPSFVRAILYFTEQNQSSLHRWLKHLTWTGPLAWAMARADSTALPWLLAPSLLMGAWVVIRLNLSALQRRPGSKPFFSAFLLLVLCLAILDWMALSAYAFASEIAPSWYALVIVVCVFGVLSVKQVVRTLRDSLRMNDILQEKLRHREQELQAIYTDLLASERSAARMAEREQIMRDMHDGMGSTLSSAKLAVQTGAIDHEGVVEVLEDCVEDLRLVLECASPHASNFLDVLSDYRHRLDRRLRGCDVRLSWSIQIDQQLVFDAGRTLHIMRIVQEAVTNVLRHTHATRLDISVATNDEGSALEVVVSNDGASRDSGKPGRGLQNMTRRAEALNALLRVQLGADASAVHLSVPVAATCAFTRLPHALHHPASLPFDLGQPQEEGPGIRCGATLANKREACTGPSQTHNTR